ncbi:Fms-interacting protein-domain-containing protein [Leucosporidium creatinivorum]|uniref:Fms-interacting protein-domain-containing protein n=1 Tax=Leucosporidium creatinivorum TaxID=106004 RepID=A0A1Y2FEN2_9BASI|nr:Fms-interacting protein-domain-containing protein [Leucosporidium creatinivorum]
MHADLPAQLVDLLRTLSDELVAQRLAQDATAPPFDPQQSLASSTPLFSALHAVNRDTLSFARDCKARTQDARLEMDSAHLRLQNLMFERNHLEREICKCEEFESEYQNLPLLPLEDFHNLAKLPTPPAGFTVPVPEDPHELMLARLQFELAERQRFEDERKELGTRKAALLKTNQAKKTKLEELEKQVDDFVVVSCSSRELSAVRGAEADLGRPSLPSQAAKSIQSNMHEEPAAV